MGLNGFACKISLLVTLLTTACGGNESDISEGPDLVPGLSFLQYCERLTGIEHGYDLILYNMGSETLEIESVTIVGDDLCSFRTPITDIMTVEPGADALVRLVYIPQTAGNDQVALEVVSNDPKESTIAIPICGKAISTPEKQTGDCPPCEGASSDTKACAPEESD